MSSRHVFVVAAGFGKRVIPMAAPFQLSADREGLLTVALAGKTSISIRSDQTVDAARAVALETADVVDGPNWPTWWLQTHPYRVPLPIGWTAHASGSVDPSAFDLVGPHDSLLFIQRPRRVPPLDELVAPGQRAVDRGSLPGGDWITVQYPHEGFNYLQRHVRVPLGPTMAVVTLQSREDVFSIVEPVQRFLVDAILPGEP
jgi:hypothetical protein